MPTLAEAKAHLRIEQDWLEEDSYISSLIAAAIAQIENDTQRVFSQRVAEFKLDEFELEIELPLVPVVSVDSISYLDESDQPQSLEASDWYADLRNMKAIIKPAYGTAWPLTSNLPECVTITYTVGVAEVPKPIEQACLLLIGHWYANRETVVVGTITAELPMAYKSLIQPYWVPF